TNHRGWLWDSVPGAPGLARNAPRKRYMVMKGPSPAVSGRVILAILLIAGCATRARAQPPADNAVRSYAAAVRLQNLESYDLAAQAWAKFLADFPNDARAGKALHYLGVCQFQNGQAEQA